jgi:hypothetical protein
MRVGILSAVALVIAFAAVSCVDNDVTFFVEHMKVQPKPPGCTTNTGDEVAASGLVDLATATSFGGWYYVTNHAMIREEYDNLRAETDGVIVDGMEAYVTTTSGALIGGSEYYEFEMYVPPESSTVLPALAIPNTVVIGLAQEYGCPSMWDLSVVDSLETAILNGTLNDQLVFEWYDAVYSRVRFIGHTQGGSEVETPEFTFMVNLCCNCLTDWSSCSDPCYAFCNEPEDTPFCQPGVANGADTIEDCSSFFYAPGATWMGEDIYGQPELQGCDITCTGTS